MIWVQAFNAWIEPTLRGHGGRKPDLPLDMMHSDAARVDAFAHAHAVECKAGERPGPERLVAPPPPTAESGGGAGGASAGKPCPAPAAHSGFEATARWPTRVAEFHVGLLGTDDRTRPRLPHAAVQPWLVRSLQRAVAGFLKIGGGPNATAAVTVRTAVLPTQHSQFVPFPPLPRPGAGFRPQVAGVAAFATDEGGAVVPSPHTVAKVEVPDPRPDARLNLKMHGSGDVLHWDGWCRRVPPHLALRCTCMRAPTIRMQHVVPAPACPHARVLRVRMHLCCAAHAPAYPAG